MNNKPLYICKGCKQSIMPEDGDHILHCEGKDWEKPTIYQQIDALQQWIRENQAKGSDEIFMAKVAELRKLMAEAYDYAS